MADDLSQLVTHLRRFRRRRRDVVLADQRLAQSRFAVGLPGHYRAAGAPVPPAPTLREERIQALPPPRDR